MGLQYVLKDGQKDMSIAGVFSLTAEQQLAKILENHHTVPHRCKPHLALDSLRGLVEIGSNLAARDTQ